MATTPTGDQDVEQYEDFDAFWEQHTGGTQRTPVRIRGQLVQPPVDVPLALAMRAEQANIADEDEVRELVGELYGPDVLDRWITAGMGAQELAVVLAWSAAHGSGDQISFERAAEMVAEALAGKVPAPNRAARRAATKRTASGSSGARSSRTSAASTASRRRSSRG